MAQGARLPWHMTGAEADAAVARLRRGMVPEPASPTPAELLVSFLFDRVAVLEERLAALEKKDHHL